MTQHLSEHSADRKAARLQTGWISATRTLRSLAKPTSRGSVLTANSGDSRGDSDVRSWINHPARRRGGRRLGRLGQGCRSRSWTANVESTVTQSCYLPQVEVGLMSLVLPAQLMYGCHVLCSLRRHPRRRHCHRDPCSRNRRHTLVIRTFLPAHHFLPSGIHHVPSPIHAAPCILHPILLRSSW